MEVSDKLVKYVAVGLGILLVLGALYLAYVRHANAAQVTQLQNEIAKRDQTIEVQKGVYAKLAQDTQNLKGLLDTSQEEQRRLKEELDKSKGQITALTQVNIRLQKQIATGTGPVIIIPPKPGESGPSYQVAFDKTFGLYRVWGSTIAPAGTYVLHLDQEQDLKLAVALARQKDGSWKSYVTSNDPNTKVDIGVTAIDETVFAIKWYERMKLHIDLGVGDGVFGGVGLSYQFGKFDIGPSVWGFTEGGGRTVYGLNFAWSPFLRH